MKYFLTSIGLWLIALLPAEIREIRWIEELFSEVRSDSIILLDIDETLIESSIMLGGKAWRNYAFDLLKRHYPEEKAKQLGERLTYWIAQRVPCIPVERCMLDFFDQMREKQIMLLGFTARGKKQWYSMPCPDGEELACQHLGQAGFDFEALGLTSPDTFLTHPRFAKGIFFVNNENKGELALELFSQTAPAHVLFVDDNWAHVCSMERTFIKLGISGLSFYYPHIELYRSCDSTIAAIQLEKLYLDNTLLSDSDAALLKADYVERDLDMLFLQIVEDLGELAS